MRLHSHKWILVGEKFNPPAPTIRSFNNATERFGLCATYGFTVVTYKCSRCPQQRFDEIVGRTVGAS